MKSVTKGNAKGAAGGEHSTRPLHSAAVMLVKRNGLGWRWAAFIRSPAAGSPAALGKMRTLTSVALSNWNSRGAASEMAVTCYFLQRTEGKLAACTGVSAPLQGIFVLVNSTDARYKARLPKGKTGTAATF